MTWTRVPRSFAHRGIGSRGRRRGDAGQSLVEMSVAVGIIAIVLSMASIIALTIIQVSSNGNNKGIAIDTVQSGIVKLEQALGTAVTPSNAYLASLGASTALANPANTSVYGSSVPSLVPCWGQVNADPADVSSANWGSQYNSTTTALTPTPSGTVGYYNENLGIVYAHDFAIEFCGVTPQAANAVPDVYEAYVNTGACTAASICPLNLVNFGSTYLSACSSSACPAYAPATPATVTGATSVPIANVWCDSYCQLGEACSTAITMGANFTAPSGWSTSGCTSSTVATTTPPMFNYYAVSSSGSGSSLNVGTNCPATTCPNGSSTKIFANDLYNSGDAARLNSINFVKLNITVPQTANQSKISLNSNTVTTTYQVKMPGLTVL